MKKKNRFSKFKYLILFAAGFIIIFIIVIGIRSFSLGTAKINYFQYAGIQFEIIKTEGDSLPALEQIKHPDYITQFDAILEIKRRKKNGAGVDALIEYIKSPQTHRNMKVMAVWALGEMKAASALDFLINLQQESHIDKYELNKAILKIKREYGMIDRIKRQFE